ncbi:hypothetical protein [Helicobacter mesocricetorum]|uniref:hypothetical protein n=1 Tax=Helicobacter mesocricetorum TaxID=87012 RepID=UPI000CF06AA4|nr:hypothetical protein [Helicobacter mesocricetorum]
MLKAQNLNQIYHTIQTKLNEIVTHLNQERGDSQKEIRILEHIQKDIDSKLDSLHKMPNGIHSPLRFMAKQMRVNPPSLKPCGFALKKKPKWILGVSLKISMNPTQNKKKV